MDRMKNKGKKGEDYWVWASYWPDPGQGPGLGHSWVQEQQHKVTLLVNQSTDNDDKSTKQQSPRLIDSLIRFDLMKNANVNRQDVVDGP